MKQARTENRVVFYPVLRLRRWNDTKKIQTAPRNGDNIMNLYIQTINDVIDHIEENISNPLTLQSISKQFYLSEFHFSRLFKTITGMNLKHYILGRKLTLALEELKNSQTPVIDIAYDLGFVYPEVFSRAFKRQFGLSPTSYRKGKHNVSDIPKAFVVERNIRNFGGVLILKENYIYLDAFNLYGEYIEADENDTDFKESLKSNGDRFFMEINQKVALSPENFYSIVNCNGDKSGKYTVFFGVEASNESVKAYRNMRIPAGWYACLAYHGDMIDMRTTFIEDFYRWMIVKEIEPYPNGIGMINIYDTKNVQNVRILIPVREAK